MNIGKLETTPADLSKISDVIKNYVVQKKLKTMDANYLDKKANYDEKKLRN